MKHRLLAFAALLLLAAMVGLSASAPHMSVDEVRPGMVGTGTTVFAGTETETFKVHVLGVLRNVMGPQRSLILAKLEGGPLAHTGVIAGMSGSPVYIDGRLVGAVAYSLGAFAKEPIAGITPINEMIETVALPARRPATVNARIGGPLDGQRLMQVVREAFQRVRPFADNPNDVQGFGLPSATAAQMAVMLRPIATPLVLGGFGTEARGLLSQTFEGNGFLPVVSGGAASDAAKQHGPLKPGDAVGVSLISGDLAFAATGTVTHVDGERVYAFGHPFYNLGPTSFPMTRSYVHTLLPSLLSSVKIASVGDVIGTFQQDRATAIAGTLGKGPDLIPVKIALEAERGLRKQFTFNLVNDQLLTPLLTYVSIINTLSAYEREYGAATFSVKGKATVKGHGDVAFEDVFAGESPSVGAATYVAAPITFLLRNDFAPVEIEAVNLTISSAEKPQTATLERVWVDTVRPKAGRTVPLKVLTRTYRGEEVIRTVPIEIPANASGTLSILVSDGSHLAQWERREMRAPHEPQNITQLLRVLNNHRKHNRLYVKLLSSDAGAVINGETLTSLPPSVLAVLEADKNGGNFIPLRSATIGEWELATSYAVSGSRLLSIAVEPY